MHRAEVLTGHRADQQATKRLPPAPLGTNAGAHGVRLAERRNGTASFVAGARPYVAFDLAGEWANRALVTEAVAVLVGPLAAGLSAGEARAAGAANNGELCGAPGTGAMCWGGLEVVAHEAVVQRGCDTAEVRVCGVASGQRARWSCP